MTEASLAAAVRDRLATVAGRDALLPLPGRFAVRGVEPCAVVAPASADHAAAVLALASEEGWTIECAGGGTWLRQGRTPGRVDVVITTVRMAGVTEYEPADLVLGLQAGTTLEALNAATAAHGQIAPLDAPAAPGSTVGAVLATASAGPLRTAEGAPRDHALGIEMVTGDGRVLRFGGRVVKNVAGYDVVRLLTGSHGTLGLITAAHIRLRARPERDVTLAAAAPERTVPVEAARAATEVEPAALELVNGEAAGGEEEWLLLVRLRGNAEAVDDAVQRLRGVAPVLVERPDAAAAWDRLARIETAAAVVLRARTQPASLDIAVDALLGVAREALPAGVSIAAHALDGTVRALVPAGVAGDMLVVDRFTGAVAAARASLAEHGGTLQVPVPPRNDGAFDPYGADTTLLPLMRRLKDAFDPAGILAPGRFVL